MNVTNIAKKVAWGISKNSHLILTSMAVSGVVGTSIFSIAGTPSAIKIIDKEKKRPLKKIEVVKLTWKCYIPAGVCAGATIGSIIALNSVHMRRNASLAAVYSLTETAFKEYRSKVAETIGKNKEQSIRDEVSKDTIQRNPVSTNEIIITGKGDVLCYDAISGRYFKSDIEKIRKIVNEFNRRLMTEMCMSLNEFYDEIGLAHIQIGDDIGWSLDAGLLEVLFSTQLAEDGNPCLVLNYQVVPKFYAQTY